MAGQHLHALDEYEDAPALDAALIECGRLLLERCPFPERDTSLDYHLATIAMACLRGNSADECTARICKNVKQKIRQSWSIPYDYGQFIAALLIVHPVVALDVLSGDGEISDALALLREVAGLRHDPFAKISQDTLFEWASSDPELRFPILASVIGFFPENSDDDGQGLSSLALAILDRAPSKSAVLSKLEKSLEPSGWTGSLANILDRRRQALKVLFEHRDKEVVKWAKKMDRQLAQSADYDRERERDVDRSFE